MRNPVLVVAVALVLAVPVVVWGQEGDRDGQGGYPQEVLERYWECMERNDLNQIRELLWYHKNVERVDASAYGLPRDDFDDDSPLTIEERLVIRTEKLRLADELGARPLAETGPLQYPHHLREAFDHYYESKGLLPDCSRILAEVGGETGGPEALGSGWASDLDLTSSDTRRRGEVNVVIDHASPNRLLASSVSGQGTVDPTSNFIAHSTDWGASWALTSVGNNSGSQWECDPVSYYQRSTGWVYHSKIGCNTGTCGSTYTMMRYSSDNGATWSDCGRPDSETGEDRQWHVVDNTPTSSCYRNIYITWHNLNQEKVARSTDNCLTWVNLTDLTPDGLYSAITPDINVAADGHVYLVWGNYRDSTFRMVGSSDCGVTWDAPSSKVLKSQNGRATRNYVPAQCQRGSPMQPLVDVDRAQQSPFFGRVYVAMMDYNQSCLTQAAWTCTTWDSNWTNSCNLDIWFMHSDNQGATWSTPVNLTSAEGTNVDHFMGYMRVDESDGSIYLSYHRSRLAPASAADRQKTYEWLMRSTDGGATWETYRPATREGDERTGTVNSFERGDYNSLDVFQGVVWPIWIDRRGALAEENIVTRKVCTEPAHWTERSPTFAPPIVTVGNGSGGARVDVSWPAPDIHWGDGGEDTASRSYQLYVDGSLAHDGIDWNATVLDEFNVGDCDSHQYRIRAINQCGIFKDYATTTFAATNCCPNNPSSVDVAPNGPLTLCEDTAQVLTAIPTGGSGLTYQWYRDGLVIVGAANPTYTALDSGSHSYNCEVRGTGCATGVMDGNPTGITWSNAPAFEGLTSATQLSGDRCGVRLEWDPATTSCAPSLVYNVYRSDETPVVPESLAPLATCVTDTFFEDTQGIVAGRTYYYVVRAEDSTVGGTGPCNGGNQDTNVVERFEVAGATTTQIVTVFSDSFDTTPYPADYLHTGYTFGNPYTSGTCASQTYVTDWYEPETGYCSGNTMASNNGAADPAYRNYNNGALILGNAPAGSDPGGILLPLTATSITLTFNHWYDFEVRRITGQSRTVDGGRVMISAASWPNFSAITPSGGYPGAIYNSTSYCHPFPGQPAYVRDSGGGCVQATYDLTPYKGQRVWLAWQHGSDSTSSINDGWMIDNVVITAILPVCSAPLPLDVLTTTSTSGQNKLEWVLPGGENEVRIVWRTDRFPTGVTDYLGSNFHDQTDSTPLDGYDTWTHSGLGNGTTYYYAAFVSSGGVYSAMQTVSGRPEDTSGTVPGSVKWVYNTGATALTPPGLGSLFGVSNDRVLHGMVTGTTGGTWPSSWKPTLMQAPAQGRPSVLEPMINGVETVVLGSQDGYVYAVDATTGSELWHSPLTGDFGLVQATPSGIFTEYGGAADLVLVGTRNAGQDNTFHGIYPLGGGSRDPAWSYSGEAGNRIGIVSGDAWVEYTTPPRVYFASRERSAGSGTLWCLTFGASSAAPCTGSWPVALGDVDGGPVVRNGTVYVGNNAGVVYAVNASTGAVVWSHPTNDGPVKGFVWAEWMSDDLYLSTTERVWSLQDAVPHQRWSTDVAGRPSMPLVVGAEVVVGSTDGRLHRLSTTNGAEIGSGWLLGDGTAAVGSPTYEVGTGLVYVGSESGAVYAVRLTGSGEEEAP